MHLCIGRIEFDTWAKAEITIGPNMNKSLHALVQVAQALSSGPKAVGDANFELSKFTRLAKFSLGGNCRTHVVACLHDQDDDIAPHVLSFCEHMARVCDTYAFLCSFRLSQRLAAYTLISDFMFCCILGHVLSDSWRFVRAWS